MSSQYCNYRGCCSLADGKLLRFCNQDHFDRALMDDEHADPFKRRVLHFSLQISNGKINAHDFLLSMDSNVPRPCPLEGGDGKGALYETILSLEKKNELIHKCESTDGVRIYNFEKSFLPEAPFRIISIEKELYSSENKVQWNFHGIPKILPISSS